MDMELGEMDGLSGKGDDDQFIVSSDIEEV